MVKTVRHWAKTALKGTKSKIRRVTWPLRRLPDFLVIGAQKSGTSSMYSYLKQHPQVLPAKIKEVHYFDGGLEPAIDNYKRGSGWYRTNFPSKLKAESDQKVFEASPCYLFNPLAPRRISELLPEVKLIAVLRNPVERAISHYFHEKGKDRESLPIMEALQIEEQRLQPLLEAQDYKHESFMQHSYQSRGVYHEQLKRVLDYFPAGNLLVIQSEKFWANPAATLRQIFDFVGVDSTVAIKDLKPRKVAQNKTRVAADVYQYLEDYFRPHNDALYELLGKNFGW